MIEPRRLENVAIFVQTVLSFVLSRKNIKIQLMLQFFKAPLLVQHFSYYALMTFLMILCVTLLAMLMIILSSLSAIRHVICGRNSDGC